VVSDVAWEEILRTIPGARGLTVPDAGHMVAGDDNDVFVDSLHGFLADIVPLASRAASDR